MVIEVKDCLENDVCFGHLAKRWHPNMKDFILTKKNNIHIIDARKTIEQLKFACDKIVDIVANGGKILFVGTKKQFNEYIEGIAKEVSMPYVTHKWAAGMLTNFVTIRRIIKRIETTSKMIESTSFKLLPKKKQLIIKRDLEKKKIIFEGISGMFRMPGAIFVVDINYEKNVIKEAKSKKIPVIGIVDTNSDPTSVNYPIPANDDSLFSVRLITEEIKQAIIKGNKNRNVNNITDLQSTKTDFIKKNEVKKNVVRISSKSDETKKNVLKVNVDKNFIPVKDVNNVKEKKNTKKKIETINGNVKNIVKELKNLKSKK